jgi:hypothetical protein
MRRATIRRLIGIAGVTTVATLVPVAAAGAADYPGGGTPPDVSDNTEVQGAQAARSTSTLPLTGGDVVGLALIGAGAVGVGAVAVRRSRARA